MKEGDSLTGALYVAPVPALDSASYPAYIDIGSVHPLVKAQYLFLLLQLRQLAV